MADGVEVRVTGANQLRALARDLKAAGEPAKGLRLELLKAMRLAAKPMVEAVKDSARQNLPKRGGLNVWVADESKISVRNNLAGAATGSRYRAAGSVGSRLGMRIVATKGNHDLEDIDNGSLRHPVYGNRSRWVSQSVYQGWFTKPLNDHAPQVQAEVLMAMDIIGRRIEKGIF